MTPLLTRIRPHTVPALFAVCLATLPACAPRPAALLSHPEPERARAELATARIQAVERPNRASTQLRLGIALYYAGHDAEAAAALARLTELPGEEGVTAALYLAAIAERQGDWTTARRGYARYVAFRSDAAVRRRLRDAIRREAEAEARTALLREQQLDITALGERTVTVLPLRVASSDSTMAALGYGLADLIATDLARTGKLELVERARVDALLRELTLAQGGAADEWSAPRTGLLVGARRVVGGTLTLLPRERLRIDASVTDVATSDVMATHAAAATLRSIFDAETELVLRILASLGVTPTPAERRLIEQRPTKDLGAFLAYSRGVRDEAHGRFEEAARAYEQALARDPGFALAQERLRATAESRHELSRGGPGAALVNRVNPSPASRLSESRTREDPVDTLLERSESAVLIIPIFIIPIP